MSRSLGLAVILVAVMSVLFGGLWYLQGERGGKKVAPENLHAGSSVVEEQESKGGEASGLESTATTDAISVSGEDGERVPLPRTLSGQVQLKGAALGETARVVFIGIEQALSGTLESRSWEEWELMAQSMPSAPVEQDGSYSIELNEDSAPEPDGFLGVAAPAHDLAWATVSGLGQRPDLDPRPSEVLQVEVRDSTDEAGAQPVRVMVVYSEFQAEGEPSETRRPLLIPIEYAVDENNAASVARSQNQTALWAVSGSRRSAEWRGSLDEIEHIVLDLSPSFSASGVLANLEILDPAPSDLRVSAYRADEEGRRRLGEVAVDGSGRWALANLPTDEATPIVFRLGGKGIVPQERRVPAPAAGDSVQIAFGLTSPRHLTIRVVDADEQAIENARMTVLWGTEPRVRSSPITTDESGKATLLEAPPGEVWIDVAKDGYVGGEFGPHPVHDDTESRVRLVLSRAGRITGQCTRAGEPVRAFTIRYWTGTSWHVLEKEFANSLDGSFILDDAPLGTVQLFAMTPDCPSTELQVVEVVPEADSWVEIEIPIPGAAMGRVVDSTTGVPIPGAEIQVLQFQVNAKIGVWGAPYETNALGEFSGVPVTEPLTMLEVSADDYATDTRRAMAAEGAVYDCGEIALSRAQDLTITLVGSDERDLSKYSVDVDSSAGKSKANTDADGFVQFQDVSPGPTWITVTPPGDGALYVDSWLYEGEAWNLKIPIQTTGRVTIVAQGQDGSSIAAGMWAGISYVGPGGRFCKRYTEFAEAGLAEFDCVFGDEVVVEVLDREFKILSYELVPIDPEGLTEIPITLTDATYELKFIDSGGEALTSTTLLIRFPEHPVSYGSSYVTDEDGRITIVGIRAKQVTASMIIPGVSAHEIPVLLEEGLQEPIEVVVDTGGQIDLRVLDGDQPLLGLWVHLRRRAAGPLVVSSLVDPDGSVDVGALASGEYLACVDQPGYWPSVFQVEAWENRPRFEMQVRRLGAAAFEVRQAGQPGNQIRIELTSTEFGEAAGDWLAAGRIKSSTGTMQTNIHGQLVLSEIPHGRYTWRATMDGSAAMEGEVVVPPHQLETAVVDWP